MAVLDQPAQASLGAEELERLVASVFPQESFETTAAVASTHKIVQGHDNHVLSIVHFV